MDHWYVGGSIEVSPPVPAETLAGSLFIPFAGDDAWKAICVARPNEPDADYSLIEAPHPDDGTYCPDDVAADLQELVDLIG